MSFSCEASHQGSVQAMQIGTSLSFDFKPVFYFLPTAIHTSIDLAINYNFVYDLDQNMNFPNVEEEALVGSPTYAGAGMNIEGLLITG